jgi:hypothetical protein
MTIRSPLLTLAALACAAVSIWLVNGSHEPGAAVPAAPAAAPVATPAAEPAAKPGEPPRRAESQPMRFVAEIPTRDSTLTLDITVEGESARAYACDNEGIEVWLRGRAADGVVTLANTGATSRLDGQLTDAAVTGTLSVDGRQWRFTAGAVEGGGERGDA